MKEEKLPYTVLAIIIIIRSISYSRRLRGVIPTYCKTRGELRAHIEFFLFKLTEIVFAVNQRIIKV